MFSGGVCKKKSEREGVRRKRGGKKKKVSRKRKGLLSLKRT